MTGPRSKLDAIMDGLDAIELILERRTAERDRARALAVALEEQLSEVAALADEWAEDQAAGRNGRYGYHAAEYGDLYAAGLRAILLTPDTDA